MIYFTDLDFLPFSGEKNYKYSWNCLSPEMNHLEKKRGEGIFNPYVSVAFTPLINKQPYLVFARNIKVHLNCKSDLIKMVFSKSHKQIECVSNTAKQWNTFSTNSVIKVEK